MAEPGTVEMTVSSQSNIDPVFAPLMKSTTTYSDPGLARPVVVKRILIRGRLS